MPSPQLRHRPDTATLRVDSLPQGDRPLDATTERHVEGAASAHGHHRALRALTTFFWSALAAVGAFTFFSWRYTTPAAWIDESATLKAVTRTWPGLWRLGQGTDAPLLPYYVMMRELFPAGATLAQLRLVSIVACAVAVGALFWWAARRHGAWFALLTAALATAVPLMSRFAQEARPYALLCCTITLTWAAWGERQRRRTWAAGLFVFLAAASTMLVHLWGALALPGIVLAELLTAPTRRVRSTLGLIGWFALAVLVDLPQTLNAMAHGSGPLNATTVDTQHILANVVTLIMSRNGLLAGGPLLTALAVLGALSWGMAFDARWRPTVIAAWCWGVVPVLLGVGLAFSRPNTLRARYWIGSVPGLALIAALAVTFVVSLIVRPVRLPPRLRTVIANRRARGGALAGRGAVPERPTRSWAGAAVAAWTAIVLVGTAVAVLWPAQLDVRGPAGHGEDMRPALVVLRRAVRDGEPIIVSPKTGSLVFSATAPDLTSKNLAYLVNDTNVDVWPVPRDRIRARYDIGHARRLWWLSRAPATAPVQVDPVPTTPGAWVAPTRPQGLWGGPWGTVTHMGFRVVSARRVSDTWVLFELTRSAEDARKVYRRPVQAQPPVLRPAPR